MSKFKDSVGRYFTQGLFWETCTPENKDRAIYTLKEQEHHGLPSLKTLYLELSTSPEAGEYDFAIQCLDGWKHWSHLCSISWFKPILAEWREELEVKVRSQAIKQIAAQAKGKARSYQAAKFMAEKGWVSAKEAGRPTKADIVREARIAAGVTSEVEDDLRRLSLVKK
jgi:hypothetical protein